MTRVSPSSARRGERQLQCVQRGARVAFAARRQEIDRVIADFDLRGGVFVRLHAVFTVLTGGPLLLPVLGIVAVLSRGLRALDLARWPGVLTGLVPATRHYCPPQHRRDLLVGQRLQRIHARAREQRAVDLERRVLGRRADQRHEAVLDRRQQRVLLGLVEAVDLVEEEDRWRPTRGATMGRALEHGAHLGAAGLHGAQLLEHRPRVLGEDPRERRLAGAGRPVQDHRMGVTLFDRRAQRRVAAEQVLLADELGERPRAHARRQWTVVGGRSPAGLGLAGGWASILGLEQGVHAVSIACRASRPGRRTKDSGAGCRRGRVEQINPVITVCLQSDSADLEESSRWA